MTSNKDMPVTFRCLVGEGDSIALENEVHNGNDCVVFTIYECDSSSVYLSKEDASNLAKSLLALLAQLEEKGDA